MVKDHQSRWPKVQGDICAGWGGKGEKANSIIERFLLWGRVLLDPTLEISFQIILELCL